jgi:6-hydroxycyclohex-1-ene-1-carbonyl-CoA dehydrogenase
MLRWLRAYANRPTLKTTYIGDALRAAVLKELGHPLEVAIVADPEPAAGDAIVAVAACGVCHTDLHYLDHGVPTAKPPPLILGHEISGTVVARGADANVTIGARVLVPAVLGCGRCAACRTGRENVCAHLVMFGNHVDGGYADYVAVPAHQLVPLPDDLPLLESAIIADALTTPFHAVVNRGRVRPGARVAVFGCGGIGLNVVQMAAAVGANVVAVDTNPKRTAFARTLGAQHTLAGGPNAAKELRALTAGGADVTFECVGTPITQEQAFDATANGGRLVLVGYSPQAMSLNSGRTMFREMEIVGSLGCPAVDYPRVVEMARQGRVRVSELVTGRYALADINAAFDALRAGEGIRSIVVPTDMLPAIAA